MSRTGLQHLRAILSGEIPQAPISGTLDFRLVAAEEGSTRFEGLPARAFENPYGTVHGGYACTLLDSAMGAAVMSTLDAESTYTTTQLTVNLTRPITRETGPVIAEGRVVHRGKRLATAEAFLRDGKGALLAHATTTCMIMARS
jgi:uncharacterized protein (TIGR00369 family)